MSMTSDQLKQLQEILKISNNSLTRKDFEANFKLVLDLVTKLKSSVKDNGDNLDKKYSEITKLVQKYYDDASGNLEETKRKALAYCVQNCSQESAKIVKQETEKMNSKIDKKLATLKSGERGPAGRDGASIQGRPGRDGSPDTATDIADKLNAKEEIVEQKVIIGLEEKLKKLENMVNQKANFVGGGGGVGKQNVYYYDLSASLDGSTKTFNMPAFARIIGVQLSSAPVLRPTIDWTADANAHTITFTSQIDANPLLNSGQSLIVLYAV